MPKTIGIIPARYASTRFPRKALADIAGKPMIQRVYEQVQKASLERVFVATDHEEIERIVQNFGGNVLMTSPETTTGTARCQEAIQQINENFDFVINIQGDEPFIHPQQIELVQKTLENGTAPIATLAISIQDMAELMNPNVVKVVLDKMQKALYFSRHPIPFMRDKPKKEWLQHQKYFKHLGIYGFQTAILAEITKLSSSKLEKAESLEQLSWLENGYTIAVTETTHESHGIDTPEDLQQVLRLYF